MVSEDKPLRYKVGPYKDGVAVFDVEANRLRPFLTSAMAHMVADDFNCGADEPEDYDWTSIESKAQPAYLDPEHLESLDDIAAAIHRLMCEKGWYESDRKPAEIHMLCVTELAEATESVRKGEPDSWISGTCKPEGEAVELADCLIRILDTFAARGWSLSGILAAKMRYNETRPHRHGGKVL